MTHEEFKNAIRGEVLQFAGIDECKLIWQSTGRLYDVWVCTKPVNCQEISYDTGDWKTYEYLEKHFGICAAALKSQDGSISYDYQNRNQC